MDLSYLETFTDFTIVGFVVTALIAPIIINLLYRLNIVAKHVLMGNKMNEEFMKIQGHKSGTPNMGGLMIAISVFVSIILLVPQTPLRDVFLTGWFLMTLYGFIEGIMVIARKTDEKFRLFQESFGWRMGKLLVLYLICLFTLVLLSSVGFAQLTIIGDLVIELTPLALIFGAAGMVLAIYGMEITDGADGLVTGQFIVAILAFVVLAGITLNPQLYPYLGLILGSAFVYLYFNINPARVFMGGTGTLPIGFALVTFTIVTDTFIPFFILGAVFWVELFSSASQIIAIRFFKRRIFRIAPIHHHFEAIGWPEAKVVQRFWLASAVAAVLALWVYTVIN